MLLSSALKVRLLPEYDFGRVKSSMRTLGKSTDHLVRINKLGVLDIVLEGQLGAVFKPKEFDA